MAECLDQTHLSVHGGGIIVTIHPVFIAAITQSVSQLRALPGAQTPTSVLNDLVLGYHRTHRDAFGNVLFNTNTPIPNRLVGADSGETVILGPANLLGSTAAALELSDVVQRMWT